MSHGSSFRSLADWLAWLETLSPREIDLGLDRVSEVLARLDPDLPERVVHVAGTNGKGSSVAMLEQLLSTAGYRVGCYTSPHIFEFNERIRVGGQDAADASIVSAFEAVEAVRNDVPLTYFEYTTLAALWLFAEQRCSALVLEIGLGGRLDAVNAVEPEVGLITNVALDHCDWLGNDVETIAREKAGIMRPAKPLIFGALDRPQAIDDVATETGAKLLRAGQDFSAHIAPDGRWSYRGVELQLAGLERPVLHGEFQVGNAAAVLAVIEALSIGGQMRSATVNDALSSLALPGRYQRISAARSWILDVAHNPHAARALAAGLRKEPQAGKWVAVIGALNDKDPAGIAAELAPLVDRWIAVPAAAARAIPSRRLAAVIAAVTERPCLAAHSLDAALEFARETTGDGDGILVTGSFYVVGPALEWIRRASA